MALSDASVSCRSCSRVRKLHYERVNYQNACRFKIDDATTDNCRILKEIVLVGNWSVCLIVVSALSSWFEIGVSGWEWLMRPLIACP